MAATVRNGEDLPTLEQLAEKQRVDIRAMKILPIMPTLGYHEDNPHLGCWHNYEALLGGSWGPFFKRLYMWKHYSPFARIIAFSGAIV